jgi:hypothetical protein
MHYKIDVLLYQIYITWLYTKVDKHKLAWNTHSVRNVSTELRYWIFLNIEEKNTSNYV